MSSGSRTGENRPDLESYSAFAGKTVKSVADYALEQEAARVRAEEAWRLVERYCESFKDDDFRLVFKKGDLINEISVGKEVYDSFGAAAVPEKGKPVGDNTP